MENKERLLSLDIFRGITMFMMLVVENPGNWSIWRIFRHARWGFPDLAGNPTHESVTPTDFVLPFFIFIMGVAVVFALSKVKSNGKPKPEIIKKIVTRTVGLYILGLCFYGIPSILSSLLYSTEISFRITGVLQMLSITYFISSITFLYLKPIQIIGLCILFPIVYCIALLYINIPDFGAPIFMRQWHQPVDIPKNLPNWVDTQLFGYGSPDGMLTSISASINAIIGVLSGIILKYSKKKQVTITLLSSGAILIITGLCYSEWIPIIKDLWTSSYGYITSGSAMIVLAILYSIFDSQKLVKAPIVLKSIGLNCLVLYIGSHLAGSILRIVKISKDNSLHDSIMKLFFESWLPAEAASLAFALCFATLWAVIALILYKKRIVIKI